MQNVRDNFAALTMRTVHCRDKKLVAKTQSLHLAFNLLPANPRDPEHNFVLRPKMLKKLGLAQ